MPSLSQSLAEQFNVFRVMRHGTHEKQLSNVFAWPLDARGTHELVDAPQRLFLDLVNTALPEETRLPATGYDVAQEFADLIAAQARRQLEDSRVLLASTKRALRDYASAALAGQINQEIAAGPIEKVVTRFVGQWEWCVELQRERDFPTVFLEYGPTAVAEQERVPHKLEDPDYSQVFVTLQDPSVGGVSRIAHTGVRLAEVLDGLAADDVRLRDAVLAIVAR